MTVRNRKAPAHILAAFSRGRENGAICPSRFSSLSDSLSLSDLRGMTIWTGDDSPK